MVANIPVDMQVLDFGFSKEKISKSLICAIGPDAYFDRTLYLTAEDLKKKMAEDELESDLHQKILVWNLPETINETLLKNEEEISFSDLFEESTNIPDLKATKDKQQRQSKQYGGSYGSNYHKVETFIH